MNIYLLNTARILLKTIKKARNKAITYKRKMIKAVKKSLIGIILLFVSWNP